MKFRNYLTDYAWSIIYTVVCSIMILVGLYLLSTYIIDPYMELCSKYDIKFEASK